MVYLRCMSLYDTPFYKLLARNDTGATGSHQGGIVVPRLLTQFFPHLAIGSGPTAEQEITAELFDGKTFIGAAHVRYQIQTWGKVRSPEHRLTRNLRSLLGRAVPGDAMVFQRQLGEVDKFKLTLVHQNAPAFRAIAGAGKIGILGSGTLPATQTDFRKAQALLKVKLAEAFSPTEPEEVRKLSVTQRRVRSELFQRTVRSAYADVCAFCGGGMLTPSHLPEVEAAHIIPRGVNGSNDPRNGLALCRSHHWAFDRLLWTVTDDNEILVPRRVQDVSANQELARLSGEGIRLPRRTLYHPAREATNHHRERTLAAWGD